MWWRLRERGEARSRDILGRPTRSTRRAQRTTPRRPRCLALLCRATMAAGRHVVGCVRRTIDLIQDLALQLCCLMSSAPRRDDARRVPTPRPPPSEHERRCWCVCVCGGRHHARDVAIICVCVEARPHRERDGVVGGCVCAGSHARARRERYGYWYIPFWYLALGGHCGLLGLREPQPAARLLLDTPHELAARARPLDERGRGRRRVQRDALRPRAAAATTRAG